MLHAETVTPGTLSLIKSVQSKPYAADFLLVGGTALALQMGHRTSIDLDFFSNKQFNVGELMVHLQQDYRVTIKNRMHHALLLEMDTIKVDFVYQPSEMLENPAVIEEIRMATTLEIAAMKVGAITARGRKRDFVDLFSLLNYYALPQILSAFLKKYPEATMELAMRSLFYFEDADLDPDPHCFFDFNWTDVKVRIKLEASKLETQYSIKLLGNFSLCPH